MRVVEKQYIVEKLELALAYAQKQRARCEAEGNLTEAKLHEGRETAYQDCLGLVERACTLPDIEIPEEDISLEAYLYRLSDPDLSGTSGTQSSG